MNIMNRSWLGSVLLFSGSAGAQAATFCVNTPAQLATALTTAQDNGEDDVIYLEVGTYSLSSELVYFAASDETYKLAIIGGLTPGCSSGYASSGNTILDGQNAVRPLSITAAGEVDLGRITFEHGNPAMYYGGALSLVNDSAADTYVFSSQFISNKTASGNAGGAIYLSTSANGDAFVWSNLFIANTSSGGAAIYLYGNGGTYVTGNTIVANQLFNHTGLGAVDLTGTGTVWVTNNILWNNDGYDIYDQAGLTHYANNDIGVMGGFTAQSASNNLSVDPDFNGFLSVSLAPESPLVNAGLDTAPGGVGGCCDPDGHARVQGKHVDIGAYESDVLFRNGYQ